MCVSVEGCGAGYHFAAKRASLGLNIPAGKQKLCFDRPVRFRPAGFKQGEGSRTLDRIMQQPAVMAGKACIRGIVAQKRAVHPIRDLSSDYPCLEREDVLLALRYAAWRAEGREVVKPDRATPRT